MVDLKELKPGDRVRIVNEWTNDCMQAISGAMDHWLGRVMTVGTVNSAYATMIEDAGECSSQYNGHWYWTAQAIDSIVSGGEARDDDEPEFSGDEFVSMLSPK